MQWEANAPPRQSEASKKVASGGREENGVSGRFYISTLGQPCIHKALYS